EPDRIIGRHRSPPSRAQATTYAMPIAKKATVASTTMMSMALPADRAVEGDDQRDHEEVLRRHQVIVGTGEEPAAASPRVVDTIPRAPQGLPAGAEPDPVFAAGSQGDHTLRKSGPAAVAVPRDLRPHGRAQRARDGPVHGQLRRHPHRLDV